MKTESKTLISCKSEIIQLLQKSKYEELITPFPRISHTGQRFQPKNNMGLVFAMLKQNHDYTVFM